MNLSSLISGIGYLLLSIGSSSVRTYDCHCERKSERTRTSITIDSISVLRGEVVDVSCWRDTLEGNGLIWRTIANKSVDSCSRKRHDTSNCWTYMSKRSRTLTIRSALIDASQRQFVCRLEDFLHPTICCTVNIVITNNTNTKTTMRRRRTTTMTATLQRERSNSTTTNVYSATSAPTNHSYITSFPTVSYGTFTSRLIATTSAAACLIAALLVCVGVTIKLVLKQKQLSNKVTSNDNTDNLISTENKVIPIDCLSVGKLLGEGKFGTVTEGTLRTWSQEGQIYYKRIAIKMLRDQEGVNAEELRKEAEIAVNLGRHKNVIRVYGYCIEEERVSKIVMEYAELGDLHRHLKKLRSGGLDDNKQFAFGRQIAEGMNFVISKGCVHRDLAARNVLVCAGQRLKISDFGLAKDLQSAAYYRKTSRGGVIPFRWCAPEVLLYRTYSEYSDVWSYGIVLWEITTLGGTPYPGIPVEKLFELLAGKSSYRMSKPGNCSQQLYDVMVLCWDSVPDRRPTFFQMTAEYMQYSDVQHCQI